MIEELRALQAHLLERVFDSYQRGLYNGIELALAALTGAKFEPLPNGEMSAAVAEALKIIRSADHEK